MGEFSPIGDRLVDLPSLKVGTCVVVVSTLETLAHQGPLGRQLDYNPQDDAKYVCPKIHDQKRAINHATRRFIRFIVAFSKRPAV